jgi:predicted small lipoprotein YifL
MTLRTVAIILALALALAGCARKSEPMPPKDQPSTFPRSYPSE